MAAKKRKRRTTGTKARKRAPTKRAAPKKRRAPSKRRARARSSSSSLQPGDHVKVLFTSDRPLPGALGGERMWVRLLRCSAKSCTGTLASRPLVIRGIRFGDLVTFPRSMVLQTMRGRAA